MKHQRQHTRSRLRTLAIVTACCIALSVCFDRRQTKPLRSIQQDLQFRVDLLDFDRRQRGYGEMNVIEEQAIISRLVTIEDAEQIRIDVAVRFHERPVQGDPRPAFSQWRIDCSRVVKDSPEPSDLPTLKAWATATRDHLGQKSHIEAYDDRVRQEFDISPEYG